MAELLAQYRAAYAETMMTEGDDEDTVELTPIRVEDVAALPTISCNVLSRVVNTIRDAATQNEVKAWSDTLYDQATGQHKPGVVEPIVEHIVVVSASPPRPSRGPIPKRMPRPKAVVVSASPRPSRGLIPKRMPRPKAVAHPVAAAPEPRPPRPRLPTTPPRRQRPASAASSSTTLPPPPPPPPPLPPTASAAELEAAAAFGYTRCLRGGYITPHGDKRPFPPGFGPFGATNPAAKRRRQHLRNNPEKYAAYEAKREAKREARRYADSALSAELEAAELEAAAAESGATSDSALWGDWGKDPDPDWSDSMSQ